MSTPLFSAYPTAETPESRGRGHIVLTAEGQEQAPSSWPCPSPACSQSSMGCDSCAAWKTDPCCGHWDRTCHCPSEQGLVCQWRGSSWNSAELGPCPLWLSDRGTATERTRWTTDHRVVGSDAWVILLQSRCPSKTQNSHMVLFTWEKETKQGRKYLWGERPFLRLKPALPSL